MTAFPHRLQNYILTGIFNAADIDYGFSHGLVSHGFLPGQKESEQLKQFNAGYKWSKLWPFEENVDCLGMYYSRTVLLCFMVKNLRM